MNISLDDTLEFVKLAHSNQMDKNGWPYYLHLQHVKYHAEAIIDTYFSDLISPEVKENILHAALLHDIIEDTDITEKNLVDRGYSSDIIKIVKRLTGKPYGFTYNENIQNMADEGDIAVILVKFCDNIDNRDKARLEKIKNTHPKLKNKYDRSISVLSNRLNEIYLDLLRSNSKMMLE